MDIKLFLSPAASNLRFFLMGTEFADKYFVITKVTEEEKRENIIFLAQQV